MRWICLALLIPGVAAADALMVVEPEAVKSILSSQCPGLPPPWVRSPTQKSGAADLLVLQGFVLGTRPSRIDGYGGAWRFPSFLGEGDGPTDLFVTVYDPALKQHCDVWLPAGLFARGVNRPDTLLDLRQMFSNRDLLLGVPIGHPRYRAAVLAAIDPDGALGLRPASADRLPDDPRLIEGTVVAGLRDGIPPPGIVTPNKPFFTPDEIAPTLLMQEHLSPDRATMLLHEVAMADQDGRHEKGFRQAAWGILLDIAGMARVECGGERALRVRRYGESLLSAAAGSVFRDGAWDYDEWDDRILKERADAWNGSKTGNDREQARAAFASRLAELRADPAKIRRRPLRPGEGWRLDPSVRAAVAIELLSATDGWMDAPWVKGLLTHLLSNTRDRDPVDIRVLDRVDLRPASFALAAKVAQELREAGKDFRVVAGPALSVSFWGRRVRFRGRYVYAQLFDRVGWPPAEWMLEHWTRPKFNDTWDCRAGQPAEMLERCIDTIHELQGMLTLLEASGANEQKIGHDLLGLLDERRARLKERIGAPEREELEGFFALWANLLKRS